VAWNLQNALWRRKPDRYQNEYGDDAVTRFYGLRLRKRQRGNLNSRMVQHSNRVNDQWRIGWSPVSPTISGMPSAPVCAPPVFRVSRRANEQLPLNLLPTVIMISW
jgi:hypothetical protein